MDRSRLDQVLQVGMLRSQQPDDGFVFRKTHFGHVDDLATAVLLKMEVRRMRQAMHEAAAGAQYHSMAGEMARHRERKALDDEERDLDKRIAELSPMFDHEMSALNKRIENAKLGIADEPAPYTGPVAPVAPEPQAYYRNL